MRDDPSRRNVLATGAAVALAAPLSTLTTASASDAEDWPEFKQWLETVLWLQEQWDQQALPCEEQHSKEDELERVLGACIDPVEDAMLKRPVTTERQLAMVVAIVMFHYDRPSGSLFNPDKLAASNGVGLKALLTALCRRAAIVLPEVPFTFSAEG